MTIEEILQLAKEAGASDVHMAPQSPLMFRVDGCLAPFRATPLQAEEIEAIVKTVMKKEQLAELKRNGEVEAVCQILDIARIRMNVFRQSGVYTVAIRVLWDAIPEPEKLGIPEAFLHLTERRQGLILITGTSGSGKSITLASLLGAVAERDYKNIITLENKIEYPYFYKKSMISRREIGADTMSYAAGLQAALRQDPDVIVTDALQDPEAIALALTAAAAGHLVFAVMQTADTVAAIHRIVDAFLPHQQQPVRVQLANVLVGVLAQQLLPRSDQAGRIAAYEVLPVNEEVRNFLCENKIHQIRGLLEKNKKAGMQSMDDAILNAYMQSRIAMETAVSYAGNPEAMEQKVQIF